MTLFAGKSKRHASWPRARIEEALRGAFTSVLVIGEDVSHTIYDVADRAFRFVVALVHEDGVKAGVSEVGFLARFVGFRPSDRVLRQLNGELHLAAAFIEEGELYVLAKVAVQGKFADQKFALILGAWKRDMSFVLEAVQREPPSPDRGHADFSETLGFDPGEIGRRTGAFCAAYFWRNEPKVVCDACSGRGKGGLLARECATCDGAGFVEALR